MRADDALKYAAAQLRAQTDWALDSIGGSLCETHEDELDALHNAIAEVSELAEQLGDPNRYSDGRMVKSSRWIEDNTLSTSHVWHPDPGKETPQSWRGDLPSGDPDLPAPGIYEVTTYPATQEIHVRVVRTA